MNTLYVLNFGGYNLSVITLIKLGFLLIMLVFFFILLIYLEISLSNKLVNHNNNIAYMSSGLINPNSKRLLLIVGTSAAGLLNLYGNYLAIKDEHLAKDEVKKNSIRFSESKKGIFEAKKWIRYSNGWKYH